MAVGKINQFLLSPPLSNQDIFRHADRKEREAGRR